MTIYNEMVEKVWNWLAEIFRQAGSQVLGLLKIIYLLYGNQIWSLRSIIFLLVKLVLLKTGFMRMAFLLLTGPHTHPIWTLLRMPGVNFKSVSICYIQTLAFDDNKEQSKE